MQTHLVLKRVQAHDQVGPHGRVVARREFLAVSFELVVVDVDHLDATRAQDLLAVGQTAGDPAVEDVVATRQLGRVDCNFLHAVAGADEEDDAASPCDFLDDLGRTQEVGVRHIQGDDVDAVSYAEDVAAVRRVPERRRMAEMCLVREKHGECESGRGRRVSEEGGRVVGLDEACNSARLSLLASAVPVEILQVSEGGAVDALGLLERRWLLLDFGRREGCGLVEALYAGHDVGVDICMKGLH